MGSPLDVHVLLESLPAAAYTCDADGLITYFNRRAVQAWGREPKLNDPSDRYCGSFRMSTPDGSPVPHDKCWMALCLHERKEYNGKEIVVWRPDDSRLIVEAHATPYFDEQGALLGALNIVVDITDRKRAEEQLRRSERELSEFFENATLGLHCVGPDGIILRANQAELNLLGYAADEYLGHHIAEFHADKEVIDDILRRLHAGEELHDYEARLQCKDGSIRQVVISANVQWEDGQFIHTRSFTRDITDRKTAEEALKESHRRKDEFLATLAHELRNPLAPISNAVELLRIRNSADSELRASRDIIERQVRQMSRLVDDLLDISRITSGKITLQRNRVSLNTVVTDAVESSRPLIEASLHNLTVTLPPEPIFLDADAIRLVQVFSNLLTNAAKYTEKGGHIWLTAEPQNGDVVVSVVDTGIGIAPKHLPQIFEMFSQVAPALERSQGGLGIGLSLVRGLVELHGGTIDARSAGIGMGSEFIVRLPMLESAGLTDQEPSGAGQTLEQCRKSRILVVDDNRDAAESLAMLLRLMGHDTHTSHDGLEAIQAAATFRPEVVLLDIGLPNMDGYEVARHIRQRPWGRHILLTALTGWGQDGDKRRSMLAGFDHHLTKPVDPASLMKLLGSRPAADQPPVPH